MAEAKPIPSHPKFKDLRGVVFGRLIVVAYLGQRSHSSDWLCQCECGKETQALAISLHAGSKKSCGCLEYEARFGRANNLRHGGAYWPEYKRWSGMLQRCRNPKDRAYANYGGRGIVVCQRWQDFAAFFEDMGSRPTTRHTVERIDNNGNYSCGQCTECARNGWLANCCWATRKEQQNNRRANRRLTSQGETLTITEWAKRVGIHYVTISGRLRAGWTIEKALTTPPNSVANRPKRKGN